MTQICSLFEASNQLDRHDKGNEQFFCFCIV